MAQFNRRKNYSNKTHRTKNRPASFVVPTVASYNQANEIPAEKRKISIPEVVTVKNFADTAGLPVTRVISELMKNGVLATINQSIDFDTASIIGDDLGVEIELESVKKNSVKSQAKIEADESKFIPRPPVVTIMGHVDHGKTTLLDSIRQSHVVEGESGGITQHISAYQVVLENPKNPEIKNRKITFIDTPGHAAFSAMREHGATITDMVVLIVAANDGVMPQTIEVIESATRQNVPIIVAINKVDLPDADIMKVKQQLTEFGLVAEDWGGKTIMVPVSAKTGQGIDDLLEMILLQADLMELKANPLNRATGVVIESHMEKGAGPSALVLIENGTICQGDLIAIGSAWGRVRILEDFAGRKIKEAGPSFPVRIAGLKSMPTFGDRLLVFDNEKESKDAASKSERFTSTLRIATAKKIGGEKNEGQEKIQKIELRLIIKCDAAGSLEAIKKSFKEIENEEVSVKIISEGVGPISESDVTLAQATNAQVYGFRVKELMAAKKIAETESIAIKTFDVIYKLIDDVKTTLSVLLPPEIIEEETGKLAVLGIFRDDRKGFVLGGRALSGKFGLGDEVKVLQNNNEKYRGKILSVRHEKNEIKECNTGMECGLGLPPFANVAVGDTVVAFKTTRKERVIE